MGNLEKPLTWGLVILFVGYLFMANCECGEGSTCALNNGFNISNTDLNGDVLKVDAPETVEEDEDDVESIKEDEIDDESEAVKILTEGEFIAIIREASRTGVLANANFGTGEAEYEATILEKDQEIQRLNERILLLEEDKSQVIRDVTHSEDYELKEKAMHSILKLVSMQDMTNLGRNNK